MRRLLPITCAAVMLSATLPAEQYDRLLDAIYVPDGAYFDTGYVVKNHSRVAGKRVNAVHDLDPDNEKAALAISKVCGIINDFKRVASEAKRHKGDEPAPEPNGNASVS